MNEVIIRDVDGSIVYIGVGEVRSLSLVPVDGSRYDKLTTVMLKDGAIYYTQESRESLVYRLAGYRDKADYNGHVANSNFQDRLIIA